MRTTLQISAFACATLASLATSASVQAQQASNMTFFVTSVGGGKGADLGGLAGADKHCQDLAQAVGAGTRNWRAYLSTQATGGTAAVNARGRSQPELVSSGGAGLFYCFAAN